MHLTMYTKNKQNVILVKKNIRTSCSVFYTPLMVYKFFPNTYGLNRDFDLNRNPMQRPVFPACQMYGLYY